MGDVPSGRAARESIGPNVRTHMHVMASYTVKKWHLGRMAPNGVVRGDALELLDCH